MPNHVTNRVIVTGPEKEVARFKEACIVTNMSEPGAFLTDDEKLAFVPQPYDCFDFEAIIPMPAMLHRVISPTRQGENGRTMLMADANEFFGRSIEATEDEQKILDSLDSPDWYAWSCSHWGTKWNAYGYALESYEPGKLEFTFRTAWSPPEPVFRKLVEKFPELMIHVSSFDEGWNFACTGYVSSHEPGYHSIDMSNQVLAHETYQAVYGEAPEIDEDE